MRGSDGEQLVDPTMWSSLPKEIIRLVFARLPLPLLQLRRSSLDSNWDINLNDLEFRLLCAQIHSNMCAVVMQEPGYSERNYSLWGHSGESSSWEDLRLSIGEPFNIVCSSDGGLMCLALTLYTGNNSPLVIVVVNPLTGDCRQLPEHGATPKQHALIMQMKMDRNSKHTTEFYSFLLMLRMLVLLEESKVKELVFDSGTGVWPKALEHSSELFLGPTRIPFEYYGRRFYERLTDRRGTYAFQFATGTGLVLVDDDVDEYSYENCTIVEYRLLFLGCIMEISDEVFDEEPFHEEKSVAVYSLGEYQIRVHDDGLNCSMRVTTHSFGPVDGMP